jgi:hypothetical protein
VKQLTPDAFLLIAAGSIVLLRTSGAALIRWLRIDKEDHGRR